MLSYATAVNGHGCHSLCSDSNKICSKCKRQRDSQGIGNVSWRSRCPLQMASSCSILQLLTFHVLVLGRF